MQQTSESETERDFILQKHTTVHVVSGTNRLMTRREAAQLSRLDKKEHIYIIGILFNQQHW